jgi:hypothetical protein
MEKVGAFIKGMYRDVLTADDGRILYDSGWATNTIVERCRILLAGFMKNESSSGIQFLAVGQGLEAWDTAGPPPSDPVTTTDLVTRYNPPITVDRLNLAYLDEEPQPQPVDNPTHRLQITAILEPGYPPPLEPLNTYPLREFGLFGRFEGNDYMINSIRHPVIHKDAATTLIRVIRLYF